MYKQAAYRRKTRTVFAKIFEKYGPYTQILLKSRDGLCKEILKVRMF